MLDIWSLAKERFEHSRIRASDVEDNQREDAEGGRKEAHVIICGSKQCGKTTLIQRVLEVNENPRPSIALEYKFGRSVRNNVKEVGHFWEVGGGALLANLLNVPLAAKNIETTSLVIMLDLSKSETLWNTMETLLEASRKRVDEILREVNRTNPHLHELLLRRAKNRVGNHRDVDSMRVFPIPLALVGGKYGEFQNLDTDTRRTISRALRFVAHFNGASLHFLSNRLEHLVTRGKALLGHFAFGKSFPKGVSTDFNKPLAVSFGSDSFEDIGIPVENISRAAIRSVNAYELWKDHFCERFPQEREGGESEHDPSNDKKFSEPEIDKLLEEKMRDLEMYIKQKKDREQLQARSEEVEKKKPQREFDFASD